MKESTRQLVRGLGLADTTALVIGTVIGTGVFLKAAPMAQAVGSPLLVLAAWAVAGLLSLAGALTYAELGAMLPEAGGEYVYLRNAYGPFAAFLFGWQRFVVAGSASIAGLGIGCAIFLSGLLPLHAVWLRAEFSFLGQPVHWQLGMQQLVAVGVILLLTAVNCMTVTLGGRVQLLLTILKVAGVGLIIVGVFCLSDSADWSHLARPATAPPWCGMSLFGTAILAALWGYDGWNNMPMAAGEVSSPGRNIPRALIIGMLVVMFLYCVLNLAYLYALPFEDVVTSSSTAYRTAPPVAARAAQSFLGGWAGRCVSLIFVVSAIGALNGSILANARVPFAMARDRLFFPRLAVLNEGTRVPTVCLIVQGLWACLLSLSGTFDQLTDCLMFASWIFYALVTASVFVLRRKLPLAERPYHTLGYPWVPLAFVLVAIWLIGNTLLTRPLESTAGLVLIAAGYPVYLCFRAGHLAAGSSDS